MTETTRHFRPGPFIGLGLFVLLGSVTGCGGSVFGLDSDGAQDIRVAISVEAGNPEITYVVSNQFNLQPKVTGELLVEMIEADTITTTLPLDEKFEVGLAQRVFFRVLDSTDVQSLMNLRVWIGDEQSLSEGFQPDGDVLQVLYIFGGGINYLDEIIVI